MMTPPAKKYAVKIYLLRRRSEFLHKLLKGINFWIVMTVTEIPRTCTVHKVNRPSQWFFKVESPDSTSARERKGLATAGRARGLRWMKDEERKRSKYELATRTLLSGCLFIAP